MTLSDGVGGPPFTPPPYLSASSMGTFNQCPLKFKFNKIDQIPDLPSSATLLGNFVHETLEEFYALPFNERTIDYAKALARQVWETGDWSNRIKGFVKDTEVNRFRWSAWWCVENLFKVEDPTTVEVKGIETEVNGLIGTATVKGFIDRLDGTENGVCVSDYKTGKTPQKKIWVVDKYLQLQIYATLLRNLEIADASEIKLLYLKDGAIFQHKLVPEDFTNTLNYVQGTYDAIQKACETGVFAHNKSRLCDWCAYKSICPGWKK